MLHNSKLGSPSTGSKNITDDDDDCEVFLTNLES